MAQNNPKGNLRIGFGVDIHQLVEGRPLIIGGIEINSPVGAMGHSDADVLLHSICDAMLGALALGDIGRHFPDTDPRYKGIDSKILLSKTFDLIKAEGYRIGNLDCTVLLERPKLSPYISQMQLTIADILESDSSQISIKATRGEGLGFIGKGDGIKAYCSLILVNE